MVTVQEAEQIILHHCKNYGRELIPFELSQGRLLAENIEADRDLPPCNRATMDGIAICYAALEKGQHLFKIKMTVAAGDEPEETGDDECVEIMTGAALPDSTDTVIRYEDLEINNGMAALMTNTINKGQNVHKKGKDKKQGDIVAAARQIVDATIISMAASAGQSMLPVARLPKTVIISTGNELVPVTAHPTPSQVRSSNNYIIDAALQQYSLRSDSIHIPDDLDTTQEQISKCLDQYDVLILTGGVSMGKFDYVPQVLAMLHVDCLFHKVKQRPGKPFWFGKHPNGALIFAFPGNPVSAFLCLHRYFIPWLTASLAAPYHYEEKKLYAILGNDITFAAPLQYFMQVKVNVNELGQLVAIPVEGNGSGDFANLLDSNAFMELPLKKNNFTKGEVYRIWPFKTIV